MGLLTRFKAGRLAAELIERIQRAKSVPEAEMEELLKLCRGYRAAKEKLFECVDAYIADGGDDLAFALLLLVCSELEREGLLRLVSGLGRNEGDASPEAAIPALTRSAHLVLPELLREIHQETEVDRRPMLYEVLEGAALRGEASIQKRLLLFARERYEVEREDASGLLYCPLLLLHFLGAPETAELLASARRQCRRDDEFLAAELNDIELGLSGKEDISSIAREHLESDWKADARRLGSFYRAESGDDT